MILKQYFFIIFQSILKSHAKFILKTTITKTTIDHLQFSVAFPKFSCLIISQPSMKRGSSESLLYELTIVQVAFIKYRFPKRAMALCSDKYRNYVTFVYYLSKKNQRITLAVINLEVRICNQQKMEKIGTNFPFFLRNC